MRVSVVKPARRRLGGRRTVVTTSLGLLVIGMSACGNRIDVTDAGQVGITVDQAGQPVIAVVICKTGTPVIDMSEGRKASDPDTKTNVQRGNWRAVKGFYGLQKLSVTAPDANWQTSRSPGTLQPDRLFIVDGGTTEDKNASLGGVSFHTQDLAQLSPSQVKVEGKIEPLSTFAAYRCH
jgi:hypothetical protein